MSMTCSKSRLGWMMMMTMMMETVCPLFTFRCILLSLTINRNRRDPIGQKAATERCARRVHLCRQRWRTGTPQDPDRVYQRQVSAAYHVQQAKGRDHEEGACSFSKMVNSRLIRVIPRHMNYRSSPARRCYYWSSRRLDWCILSQRRSYNLWCKRRKGKI